MAKDVEQPPEIVAGKYRIQRLIGRGGMGSVWEAEHTSLGTRVAIKFIDSQWADSTEARARFDNEARAAAKIQSKHAIQIHDHGVTEDNRPFIVMEFLSGEPLDKKLDRVGRMSIQETARVLSQISRALTRAHDRGIIHRDLKPENVFLVRGPDDDEDVAKVLDFGIAKFKQSNDASPSGTKTGSVLGTPFYMAPEQARALKTIDHRADVWSIGVLAYRCIIGELPFEGESVADLLVKICTAPVPLPSQKMPSLPPAFDAWFLRALEREPERRFATVAEQAEALNAIAGISPPSVAYPQTPVGLGHNNVHIPTPAPMPTPNNLPAHTTPVFGGMQGGHPGHLPGSTPPQRRTEPAAALAVTHNPVTSSPELPIRRFQPGAIAGIFAVMALVGAGGAALVFSMARGGNAGKGIGSTGPTTTQESPVLPGEGTGHGVTPPVSGSAARIDTTPSSGPIVLPPNFTTTPTPQTGKNPSPAARPTATTPAPTPTQTATPTPTPTTPAPNNPPGPRLIPVPGRKPPAPPVVPVAPIPQPTPPKEDPLKVPY